MIRFRSYHISQMLVLLLEVLDQAVGRVVDGGRGLARAAIRSINQILIMIIIMNHNTMFNASNNKVTH